MAELESKSPTATRSEAERRAHEIFREEVGAALLELAHHYGFDALRAEAVDEPPSLIGHQVAGIIGFAGHGFGGTLAIRAPSVVVRSCLPLALGEHDNGTLGDWIAELSNQLLGRTKNKLLRYRGGFQITPPTYAIADELLVLGCDRRRTSWLSITTTAGPLVVMVELHTAADFAFVAADPDLTPVHAEGEMMLF